MESQDLIQPEHFPHLPDDPVPALGATNVEPSREKMTRVNAQPEPFRLAHAIIDLSQMFQVMPQAASLPGGVLQGDTHSTVSRGAEHLVQPGHNLLERLLLSLAQMRSRVHDQKRQPKLGCEVDFLEE